MWSRFLVSLGSGHLGKEKTGSAVRRRSDLELVGNVVHDDPVESGRPPPTEGFRIRGIDDDLLPCERHRPIVSVESVVGGPGLYSMRSWRRYGWRPIPSCRSRQPQEPKIAWWCLGAVLIARWPRRS